MKKEYLGWGLFIYQTERQTAAASTMFIYLFYVFYIFAEIVSLTISTRADKERDNDFAVDGNQWQMRTFENWIPDNDPDGCCLIGLKVTLSKNGIETSVFTTARLCPPCKQTHFQIWLQYVCADTHTHTPGMRKNIIKTHIEPEGTRCVWKTQYKGFWWKIVYKMCKRPT